MSNLRTQTCCSTILMPIIIRTRVGRGNVSQLEVLSQEKNTGNDKYSLLPVSNTLINSLEVLKPRLITTKHLKVIIIQGKAQLLIQ